MDAESSVAENNLFRYSDAHLLGVIDFMGTVMASIAPLVSIILLYFVHDTGYRLAILCACTVAFSVSLALVTTARRIEVFACTAAWVTPIHNPKTTLLTFSRFASVCIVFVGSTNNSNMG